MSQACGGSLSFIDGGVLNNATLVGARISDSRITGSVFDAGQITNLTSIDQPSVDKILSQMSDSSVQALFYRMLSLPTEQLRDLASILQSIMEVAPTKPGDNPASSTQDELPTTVIGNRVALLGEPEVFAQYDESYVVPLYRSGM